MSEGSLNSFLALLERLLLFYSRVLLSGLGLNRGDGVAGFVRCGAVGCRGGDGTPGFTTGQRDRTDEADCREHEQAKRVAAFAAQAAEPRVARGDRSCPR